MGDHLSYVALTLGRSGLLIGKWLGAGSNRRHQDFQSCALPTELPSHPKNS